MSAMTSLIEILRAAIESRRITVTDISAACGCSRQHIYQVMNGEQQPTFALAEKIANALGAEITVKIRKGQKISA
jgi:transcriptional regulator with XRE-family HTH domain